MPKVLISDKMSPLAARILRERGIEVDERTDLTKEELADAIGAYDGLIVRSATRVTPKILERAERLKVIGRAGIGVDNIDLKAATARGIVVMNTPFGNAITTAEHAIALMLSLARQIPQANASTHAGRWEKSRFMGVEVTGKTLGIIGCGNIGSIVADRAIGLKMKVLAYDPYLTEDRARELGVSKVDLDTLLARSDFVTLHTPLTEQTRNIIDAAALAKMKEGAYLINCARGGLVDEAALKEALDSGRLAGAALDVFVEEPAHAHPLFGHPRLIATPHLGASTREAQTNVAIQIAEQVADFLLLGGVTNALNMPSMTPEEAPRLRPYMALARQLGHFMGQLVRSGVREVRIEYEGHVAELNTRPLTAVVLEGLLKPVMESVNMVNAPVIARERDIAVSEVIHERAGDYHTLMRLVVRSENRTRSVAGTLFSDQSPRIVQLDDVQLEAELLDDMLFVVNEDRPGFIGALGTLLGRHGVNIGTFNLGRAAKGGLAVALLGLDQPIPPEVLEEVRALPYVRQAAPLSFT
ncbi:MAG: D-3-phosphoglycerate dehydrogenase [Rhodothalassiaceae bacterium]|nr:MAG: D-3-phosphoglycerate dehydrogenase [Rhodothalassiaceae bacterium]